MHNAREELVARINFLGLAQHAMKLARLKVGICTGVCRTSTCSKLENVTILVN